MLDTILKIAYFAFAIASETIRAPHRARNRRDRHSDRVTVSQVAGLEAALMTLTFAGSWVLPLVYAFSPRLRPADYRLPCAARVVMGVLGGVVSTLALWLLQRGHRDLGTNWSPSLEITQEQQLVTGGVYGRVRHPIYAAVWLLMLGQALFLHNWLAGLAGLAAYAPIYFTRVPREERLMAQQFGAAYQAYMERTGRIVPRMGKRT